MDHYQATQLASLLPKIRHLGFLGAIRPLLDHSKELIKQKLHCNRIHQFNQRKKRLLQEAFNPRISWIGQLEDHLMFHIATIHVSQFLHGGHGNTASMMTIAYSIIDREYDLPPDWFMAIQNVAYVQDFPPRLAGSVWWKQTCHSIPLKHHYLLLAVKILYKLRERIIFVVIVILLATWVPKRWSQIHVDGIGYREISYVNGRRNGRKQQTKTIGKCLKGWAVTYTNQVKVHC